MQLTRIALAWLTWGALTTTGALAQSVNMLDGRTIPFNEVPAVARFKPPIVLPNWPAFLSSLRLPPIALRRTDCGYGSTGQTATLAAKIRAGASLVTPLHSVIDVIALWRFKGGVAN